MKILVTSRTEEEIERCDYRDAYEIKINGECVFKVQDDEPEDSNLSRSFGDVYLIPGLLEMAYKAGKNGEEFETEFIETDKI